MHATLQPLADILSLNTRLFVNCLDGMGDAAAQARPGGSANNAAFLACHLVDARIHLLKLLGRDVPHPFGDRLAEVKKVDDMTWYPSLDEIRAGWTDVSARLDARLGELAAGDLAPDSGHKFPIADRSLLGVVTFLTQHDSYHVGQLSLLRRAAGLPAMKY